MARLSLDTVVTNIENNQQGNYRSIRTVIMKDDRDVVYGRFLFDTPQNGYFFRTHTVTLTSKSGKSYMMDVSCNEDNCPFCQYAKDHPGFPSMINPAKDKIYIPVFVYNQKTQERGFEDVNEVRIFVRPSRFYQTDLLDFYTRNGNLHVGGVEIQRNGRRRAQDTSYRLYPADSDGAGNPIPKIDNINEVIEKSGFTEDIIFGAEDSLIREWTFDQMNEVIATGSYPKGNPTSAPMPDSEVPFEQPQPRNRTSQQRYGF